MSILYREPPIDASYQASVHSFWQSGFRGEDFIVFEIKDEKY
jgi:hypothetical protein